MGIIPKRAGNFFYVEQDPDILWGRIHDCINAILESMCPYKNSFVRETQTQWFTHEIYECTVGIF